jgi:dihydrofolate reductase
MRKTDTNEEETMELTVRTMMSMDGVTQAPGGPDEDRSGGFELGGWSMPHFDADAGKGVVESIAQADEFLLGRKTYEIFAGYWPQIGTDNPIAAAFNSRPKHVASSSLTSLDWDGASLLGGETIEAVRALKERPGRELQVHGSVELTRSLLAAGLVDRLQLLVFPVVLRSGHRLFDDPVAPTQFELTGASTTSTGVQQLTLVPSGPPVTGSFEDQPEPGDEPVIR